MIGPSELSLRRSARGRPPRTFLPLLVLAFSALLLLMFIALLAVSATTALAGQASSGELFFYPCSSCHPLTPGQTAELPIDFEGHEIVLEGHDALGDGSEPCLVCHDAPDVDPGMLKLADGSLVDIQGDVSQVCYRCHSDKYNDWVAGVHGHLRSKCTDSGCHDPHTPGLIFAEGLLPFVGSGFQFRVLSEREPFMPLAPPAPAPAVETPTWFAVLAAAGLLVAAGLIARLLREGLKR